MIEELLPGLFRIEVPLPGNPLKSVNSYVVKGPDRHLVIDTGMHREECASELASGLAELAVDLGRTDFFITHLHADHLGLVTRFASDGSTVYFNEPEAAMIHAFGAENRFWEKMGDFARRSGFPPGEVRESLRKHPGVKYSPSHYPDFTIVHERDVVQAGEYRFECIETPGHTQGHLCLYERERKLFVAGDHILGDITPNISSWTEDLDALGDYLASLDKVAALDVGLVLPGHRRAFQDFHGRIEELKEHHRNRAEEVLAILHTGSQTVYQVASRMTWDIVAATWDDFPVMQKWFAAGEAQAHLKYLEEKGLADTALQGDTVVFSAS